MNDNTKLMLFLGLILFLAGYSIASDSAEYNYNKETMSEQEFEEWEEERAEEWAREEAEAEYLYR